MIIGISLHNLCMCVCLCRFSSSDQQVQHFLFILSQLTATVLFIKTARKDGQLLYHTLSVSLSHTLTHPARTVPPAITVHIVQRRNGPIHSFPQFPRPLVLPWKQGPSVRTPGTSQC